MTTPYTYIHCPLHTSRCFLLLLQQTVVSRRKFSIWQTGSIATSYIYTHTYAHMYLCTLLNEFTILRYVPMVKYTQKVEYANIRKEFVTIFGAVEYFRKSAYKLPCRVPRKWRVMNTLKVLCTLYVLMIDVPKMVHWEKNTNKKGKKTYQI